jgi:hypothetical protein
VVKDTNSFSGTDHQKGVSGTYTPFSGESPVPADVSETSQPPKPKPPLGDDHDRRRRREMA